MTSSPLKGTTDPNIPITLEGQQIPGERDVLIAVMGPTGSGKTSFINLASGSNLEVGHTISSCTSVVAASEPFEVDGRRVILFDTPGFDDTEIEAGDILQMIAVFLERQYEAGVTLHGVIYVHRISDKKVGKVTKADFSLFRELCGNKTLQNVIIMTNMWSEVTETKGEERVTQLMEVEGFFQQAVEKWARMAHNKTDTIQSAHDIVRLILKNNPMALSIQVELVDEKRTLADTSAGQEIERRLAEQARRHQEQLAKIKKQLEKLEAGAIRDEETITELAEEAANLHKDLEKIKTDKEKQAANYEQLKRDFAAAEDRWKSKMAERFGLAIIRGTYALVAVGAIMIGIGMRESRPTPRVLFRIR